MIMLILQTGHVRKAADPMSTLSCMGRRRRNYTAKLKGVMA